MPTTRQPVALADAATLLAALHHVLPALLGLAQQVHDHTGAPLADPALGSASQALTEVLAVLEAVDRQARMLLVGEAVLALRQRLPRRADAGVITPDQVQAQAAQALAAARALRQVLEGWRAMADSQVQTAAVLSRFRLADPQFAPGGASGPQRSC